MSDIVSLEGAAADRIWRSLEPYFRAAFEPSLPEDFVQRVARAIAKEDNQDSDATHLSGPATAEETVERPRMTIFRRTKLINLELWALEGSRTRRCILHDSYATVLCTSPHSVDVRSRDRGERPELTAGDIQIFCPGDVQVTECSRRPVSAVIACWPAATLLAAANQLGRPWPLYFPARSRDEVLATGIEGLLAALRLRNDALIAHWYGWTTRRLVQLGMETRPERPADDKLVARARAYIDGACIDGVRSKSVDLSLLAASYGCTASWMGHIFRRSMGITIHQYQQLRRVRAICRMLRRGDAPETVARQAGFGNTANMKRHIINSTGIPPEAWQRNNLEDFEIELQRATLSRVA